MNETLERNAAAAPDEEQKPPAPMLQRKCGCGGSCTSCRRPRRGGPLSRARANDETAGEVPALVHHVLRSAGQPLDRQTRSFMESRFHRDFASVRIHDDATAAASARAVHARAYTVGNHVVFGSGAFTPATPRGRGLLAHELTHVVQQRGAARGDVLEIGAPDSAAEREADRNEHAAGSHAPAAAVSEQPAVLARQPATGGQAATPTPASVELVRISCSDRTIEFVTDQGTYRYPITDCDISADLDYVATVAIVKGFVQFSEPPQAGQFMRFRFRIRRGEPNPSTFFRTQHQVRVITGNVTPQPPSSGGGGAQPGEEGGGAAESPSTGTGTTPGTGWGGPVVCSRPLAVRGLGMFKHAFVHDDPYNYAIREPLFWGNGLRGCAPKTDASGPPDDPATSPCKRCNPAPGQTIADVSACLRAAYSAYSHPNIYQNFPDPHDRFRWGPNSNTFGATLARCCHDFNPSGLGPMPGWNHSPAGPCNASGPDGEAQEEAPGGGPSPDAGRGPSDAGVPLPGGLPESAPLATCSPVNPTGSPTITNPAPDSSFLPSHSNISWDVIDIDPNNWGACVTQHQAIAAINIRPWPSEPASMTVPNTPNPVDGGNIENRPGSKNHWEYAIDDMADYDTAGTGGAGADWHSTAASEAHEMAHWTEDWLGDALTSAAGGNWPVANTDINALREPKSSSPTSGAARTALQPRVNARLGTYRTDVTRRYNAIVATDTPGGGGRGYAAGMRVLNNLIAAVRAYANGKGW